MAGLYEEAVYSYHCDVIYGSHDIAPLRNQQLNLANVSSRNELAVATDLWREKAHTPAKELAAMIALCGFIRLARKR